MIPSAFAPKIPISGSSSIMNGTVSAVIETAFKLECLTKMSPVISPDSSFEFRISISAPISMTTFRNPVRVGLSPTFLISRSLPSIKSAAVIKNAAEEKSPGILNLAALNSKHGSNLRLPLSFSMVAPHSLSIISVWSREGCGSDNVIFTPAHTPARRIADLT